MQGPLERSQEGYLVINLGRYEVRTLKQREVWEEQSLANFDDDWTTVLGKIVVEIYFHCRLD